MSQYHMTINTEPTLAVGPQLHDSAPNEVGVNSRHDLELAPAAQLLGKKLLGILVFVSTIDGMAREDSAPSLNGEGVTKNPFQRFRLLMAHDTAGTAPVTYGMYYDKRIVDFRGEIIEAEMPKIRTCDLDPPAYDPNKTGTQVDRTLLGRFLTKTWLDELPQLFEDSDDAVSLAAGIVGPRARKKENLGEIPLPLYGLDADAYALPKGIMDASGPLRKSNDHYAHQSYRSACDIAYADALQAADKNVIDSAIVYETIASFLPRQLGRMLNPLLHRMVPHIVSNIVAMDRKTARKIYEQYIITPANTLLAEVGLDQIVLS